MVLDTKPYQSHFNHGIFESESETNRPDCLGHVLQKSGKGHRSAMGIQILALAGGAWRIAIAVKASTVIIYLNFNAIGYSTIELVWVSIGYRWL